MAAGGVQLLEQFEARTIDTWRFHVDWKDPSRTTLAGPEPVAVAPYRYLCDGQLSHCVPQPGTERAARRAGRQDHVAARLSPDWPAGVDRRGALRQHGGGRRRRALVRVQGGGRSPDRAPPAGHLRARTGSSAGWRAPPSTGRATSRSATRSAARRTSPASASPRGWPRDPPGVLTLREAVLVEGEAAQPAMRWEDYTQTAMDPSDDCTIWYVGDYMKKGAAAYSTRIGAFRIPGCAGR